MGRCEAYYKLENRRCDGDGEREIRAVDGDLYLVCTYHHRQVWTSSVARWHGQSGLRRTGPAALRTAPQPQAFAWS